MAEASTDEERRFFLLVGDEGDLAKVTGIINGLDDAQKKHYLSMVNSQGMTGKSPITILAVTYFKKLYITLLSMMVKKSLNYYSSMELIQNSKFLVKETQMKDKMHLNSPLEEDEGVSLFSFCSINCFSSPFIFSHTTRLYCHLERAHGSCIIQNK